MIIIIIAVIIIIIVISIVINVDDDEEEEEILYICAAMWCHMCFPQMHCWMHSCDTVRDASPGPSLAIVRPFTEQWENLEAAFLSIVAWSSQQLRDLAFQILSTWTAPEPTRLRMDIEPARLVSGLWPLCRCFLRFGDHVVFYQHVPSLPSNSILSKIVPAATYCQGPWSIRPQHP